MDLFCQLKVKVFCFVVSMLHVSCSRGDGIGQYGRCFMLSGCA